MRRSALIAACCCALVGCAWPAGDGVGSRATPQPRTLTDEELARVESAIDAAAPAVIKMTDVDGRDQWSGLNLFPFFDYLDVDGQGLAIIVDHVTPVVTPPSLRFEVVACQTIGDVLVANTCADERVTIRAGLGSEWTRFSLEYCNCPLPNYPDDGWVIIVRPEPTA
jgi:hypothetical protein